MPPWFFLCVLRASVAEWPFFMGVIDRETGVCPRIPHWTLRLAEARSKLRRPAVIRRGSKASLDRASVVVMNWCTYQSSNVPIYQSTNSPICHCLEVLGQVLQLRGREDRAVLDQLTDPLDIEAFENLMANAHQTGKSAVTMVQEEPNLTSRAKIRRLCVSKHKAKAIWVQLKSFVDRLGKPAKPPRLG